MMARFPGVAQWVRRFPVLTLVLVAIVSALQPWYQPALMPRLDWHRWIQLTAFFMAGIVVAFGNQPLLALIRRLYSDKRVVALWALLVMTTLLSLRLSPFPVLSATELAFLWVAIVLVHAMAAEISMYGRRHWVRVVDVLLCIVAIYTLQVFIGYAVMLSGGGFDIFLLTPGFSNVRHYSGTAMLLALILSGGFFARRAPRYRAIVMMLVVSQLWLLMTLGSRGALAAFIGAVVIVIVVTRSREVARFWLATGMASGVAFLLLSIILPQMVGEAASGTIVDDKEWNVSGRDVLYAEAWRGFLLSPWFGHGPMSFAWHSGGSAEAHPHNLPLQVLYEYGLATVVALAGVFLLALRGLLRHWSLIREDRVSATLLASVLAFLALSLVSGPIIVPTTLCLVMIAGAVLMARVMPRGDVWNQEAAHGSLWLGSLAGILTLALMAGGYLSWRFVTESEYMAAESSQAPRFFQYNRLAPPEAGPERQTAPSNRLPSAGPPEIQPQ